jgi:hypothetical protein
MIFFKEIPPYNGFGSIEDSLQNCLRLQPERPKKDYVKLMENDHRVLRYEAVLVRYKTIFSLKISLFFK